jgi:hypothetical protein
MTKEEILNGMSEEEFYNLYPTEEAYFMAKGGSLSGAPHNGQPTADEFFSYGAPALGHMNIPMSNPTYLAHGGTYFGGPTRPYAYGGLYQAANGTSTSPYGTNLYTEKKMTPQEWDKYNTGMGYSKIPGKGQFATYYNPKEYTPDENFTFTKVGDVGKTVNYSNDPNYKPIMQYGYKEEQKQVPAKPTKVIPELSNRTAIDTNEYFKTLKGPNNKLSYYDIKTNEAIDPTKSFQGGKYNPSLLNPPVAENNIPRPAIDAVTMAYGGGLPGGANEMPCMNCGGYMNMGGYNSPTNYGSFSVPMAEGGYYQKGGVPKELMDWAANQQAMLEARTNVMVPPYVKKYFGEYDEPRKFDSTHAYPRNPNIAMGFKGNKVMLVSKDEDAENMVRKANKLNSYVGPTVKGERDIYFDYLHPHEYGGILDSNNNQDYPVMDQGGRSNLMKIIKAAGKKMKKEYAAGGNTTMQGGNQDYLTNMKGTYDNFLKQNVYNSLVDQEQQDISKAFMQMGGFSQPMINPNNVAYQQGLNNNISQFEKQNAADNQNFLNATTNFVGSIYDTRAKNKAALKEIQDAAQSSMPKAEDGEETKDKTSWFQKLAKNFPANSGRGYGLSNKDYNKLYNMPEGTISSGLGLKYGPLARALGKTGRNLFGPKEIYMDLLNYNPTIHNRKSLQPFKGPYPEAGESPFTEGFPAMHTVEEKPSQLSPDYLPQKQITRAEPEINPGIQRSLDPEMNAQLEEEMNNIPDTYDAAVQQMQEQGIKSDYKKRPGASATLKKMINKTLDYEKTKGGYDEATNSAFGLSDYGYHKSQLPEFLQNIMGTAGSMANLYSPYSPKYSFQQPTTKEEAAARYENEILPQVDYFSDDALKGRAADFLYNSGRDPRVYMMDQYLKSKGEPGLPNRGYYNKDIKTAKFTPEIRNALSKEWSKYGPEIEKLPREEQIKLLDQARDFYYQNTAPENANWDLKTQGPYPAYGKTWKGRIGNLSQFQRYGGLPMAATGFTNPVDMTMNAIANYKPGPEYLPMKSATDMFAKQTEADLKNTLDNTEAVDTRSAYSKDRVTFKRQGLGKAFAQYAPAVANQIASGFEARDYQKAQEDLANSQTADRMFLGSTGNRGDYDPNSGMFRPNQMVPVQYPGGMYGAYGGSFQYGGMYEEGEELDLSPEEIEELRNQGYEIEELD